MAPGCGDIDHKIGKKLSLINIAPLDDESKFIKKFGWLSGQVATDKVTIQKIIEDLKKLEVSLTKESSLIMMGAIAQSFDTN